MNTKNSSVFRFTSSLLICGCLLLSGCGKQKQSKKNQNKKTKKSMDVAQLQNKANNYIQKKDYESAIELLEKIIAQNQESDQIHNHKIALADAYFRAGKYQPACDLYGHFNMYYPSDSNAEYAKYKSVLSKFYQTLKTDCNQEPTQDTIKLCLEYCKNISYNKYRRDVCDIQNTCEHKLIDKEIYVYNFYLQQGEYKAAQNRLNNLKTKFLVSKTSLEPRLLYLECKLAQKSKNDKLAEENLKVLFSKHSNSQYTRMAQSLFVKKEFNF
jgi:outer membrane assembly lipoprotein YfiO